MAIAFTNQGASATPDVFSTTGGQTLASGSWTPPAELVIVFVFASHTAANTGSNPTMSGNGLTWVSIAHFSDTLTTSTMALFGANGTGASAGATTVDFGAGFSMTGIGMSFFSASGTAVANGVAQTFVQAPTADSSTSALSGSVSLAAAGDANNRPISGWMHAQNQTTTARTNWTEMDDGAWASPVRGCETQVRTDAFETTASASWGTSAPWLAIAAEIKVAGATATSLATPPPFRRFNTLMVR